MKKTKATKFPVARIKKIMQMDDDVGKIATATPVLVSKALELFMASLVEESVKETRAAGGKKLTAYHVKRTVTTNPMFDFLIDTVASVPDPIESSEKEKKPRAPRKKKATTAATEEEDDYDEDDE